MDPIRPMAERVARYVGCRWPEAYLGRALRFHLVHALGQRIDTETRVAQLPGGVRLVVSLRDYALRELYFKGSRSLYRGWLYEPETTRFVMRWLGPGDVFLDIGANAGYYTAIAAAIIGSSGRVHAFEPNPPVARLLRMTLEVNSFTDRAEVNRVAVNSSGASVEIFRPTDPGATGATTTVPLPSQSVLPPLKVPAVTIDSYVAMKGITNIRLIKIDVEGAEADVISGASQTLEAVRPEALLCEFCPEILVDPATMWRRLLIRTRQSGYRPFFLAHDGALIACDGRMPEWKVGNLCFLPEDN
jgi:FkbM family methyltransferase